MEVYAINAFGHAWTDEAERLGTVSTYIQGGGKGQRQKRHEQI